MSATAADSALPGHGFGRRRRLPMLLQTEAAECGLASAAMVGCFHGHDIDVPSLRQRESLSLKGMTLTQLIAVAGRLDLAARPLRVEMEHLRHLRTPCILHWDLNHFVVLKQATAKMLVIHDPAQGVRRMRIEEASKHFTGVALELWPAAQFKAQKARQSISIQGLMGDVHGLKRGLTQVLLLALALEGLVLVGPFYLQWVIDQVLVTHDASLLGVLVLGFLLLTVFQVAVTAMRAWSIVWISATLSVQWVGNLFGHLLHLPLAFFEKRHIGDVVSRFGSVQTIQQTLTTQFVGAALDGLMSIITLVVMAFYSVWLTALVLGAFVLYALLRWGIFRPLRRATEDHLVYAARQQSDLLESIRGMQPLKLANQQDQRRARYANTLVDTTQRAIAIQRWNIAFQAGNGLVFGAERVLVIGLAALLVLRGEFSVGMLVAFVAYADQFTQRAGNLIDHWNEFRMLGLHAERVADIALTQPEAQLHGTYTGPEPEARLEVKNLSFRYAEGEPWVIKDLNFSIAPGESVAIAAPSGTGKTTLAKLVLGLLEPTEGTILYGGIDLRTLGLARYRSLVAAVMQDDTLFAGSLADNISLFDPEATPLKVEAVARQAQIHDEIVAMPMGYQTLVGDMGSSLSGGQKQRVLLARALYRKPRFLVLDEATSHLDVAKEREVNALVKRMQLTRLVLAHRPETLESAERIIALKRRR
ncbi:peptidase domain-containing ABC transporter [Metallibacterium scheffleri]|uniref:ABC transporter n=1 Tax=Metallibacterium scheffleri TaxID=993689 RepID=A0A4S3KKE8_9GAMM|nr:peptidase domain-containing ABC transporter [Metallibacterium scheffleri]THD09293.1 ABC transporter [Metallibacterium scheffleri]